MAIKDTLFDRFDSRKSAGIGSLARDLTDVLGARRAFSRYMGGVLDWGLGSTAGLAPTVEGHRQLVADDIARTIAEFEPRLEDVSVTPVADSNDFAFRLDARLVGDDDDSVTLRILSPRRGGGLGADIVVLGSRVTPTTDEAGDGQ